MRKRSGRIRNLLLTLLVAVTLTECSASGTSGGASEPQSNKSEDVETIEFAVMGPMTGDTAGLGQQQEYGARFAVREIDKNGGINGKKLVHNVYNDRMNTSQAVIYAGRVVTANEYRSVVISISTGCSKAAYPTWADADLPVLSGVNMGNTTTELGYKNYLKVCARDSTTIKQICDYIVNKCGVRKPAILYIPADTDVTNFDFTKNYLKDKYNIDIIDSTQIQVETEKGYIAYITDPKGKSADTIYLFTRYNPARLFLKQRVFLGWDIQVFGNTGCANPLISQVADAECTKGFITMPAFDTESTNECIRKFTRSYTELTDMDPGREAAEPYDLVCIVLRTLENEETDGLDGNVLVEWFRSNASYLGIMVDVEGFDTNGDNPNAKPYMLIVKNGTRVGIDGKQKKIKRER